ncbi:hypothetical protein [Ferrimonas lipolytica]|uniref:Lipoprotein n=1 Tax=Ferrimonas lipolytica TaxID=2724191 RepID=A0A6H1UFK9_9GAMM|nr:hypothetical protein [Ferrimonas lipolytica]QIZ76582.1 hypothetical protein HER31_06700 [Ferrimonas lipolytica]
MNGVFFSIVVIYASMLLSGCGFDKPTEQGDQPQLIDPTLCQFSQGSCRQANASLAITPVNAPSEQPLLLQIYLPDGYEVVDARIEGRDMFMGVIPIQFAGNQATATYGSCSSDYMVWRLFYTAANQNGEQISGVFDWLADN